MQEKTVYVDASTNPDDATAICGQDLKELWIAGWERWHTCYSQRHQPVVGVSMWKRGESAFLQRQPVSTHGQIIILGRVFTVCGSANLTFLIIKAILCKHQGSFETASEDCKCPGTEGVKASGRSRAHLLPSFCKTVTRTVLTLHAVHCS